MVQPSQSRLEKKLSWHGRHITSGFWQVPAVKRLDLSNNMLDKAAVAWLAQADWPLEELQLDGNRLGVEAMEKLVLYKAIGQS